MLLYIHNATRHMDESTLKYKSEVIKKVNEWHALREVNLGDLVKRFCTDVGSEYTSKIIAEYLQLEAIIQKTPMPDSCQSNGVVEQATHSIIECVRCMLHDAGLWNNFLAFALSVVVYRKHSMSM